MHELWSWEAQSILISVTIVTIRTVEDAYQMALKAEEKLRHKKGQ